MKKQTIAIIGFLGGLLFTGLTAEPRIINRDQEAKDFPALQETEKRLDANIADAYNRISVFGPLVEKAKLDRISLAKEKQDPLNFNNMFRLLKFTPRNTYVRFVSEDAPVSAEKPDQKDAAAFIFAGLGDKQEIIARIDEKVKQATAAGVKVASPAFQNRDGVELTQFEFIY
ncbi:MAG: hypothetical protein HY042_03455, partial [Spirochaetia bacterium]|nr:hypothetical protein [Spirochaetia bacterium]